MIARRLKECGEIVIAFRGLDVPHAHVLLVIHDLVVFFPAPCVAQCSGVDGPGVLSACF